MQFIDLKSQYLQIKDQIAKSINRVLEHGQYIMGPEVHELEEKLASYVGVKHAIAVSNGSDALIIALMALGINPGDEVITTVFSFIATANAIIRLGAKPVFVDIQPDTYNIDPNQIEAAITERTKAIITVDLYGECADYDAINLIAKQYNLAVIADAAQSFGATYKNRRSCSLTTIACTSFFPTKPLGGYGDGGACFTHDDMLALRMQQIRLHGAESRYYHVRLGMNARLDTIQAAILLVKLTVLDEELQKRQQVANYYYQLLGKTIKAQAINCHNISAFAQFAIEMPERERVMLELKKMGIPTFVHYPLILSEQPTIQALRLSNKRYQHASHAAQTVLCLPMHPYLTVEQVNAIASALLRICDSQSIRQNELCAELQE